MMTMMMMMMMMMLLMMVIIRDDLSPGILIPSVTGLWIFSGTTQSRHKK